MKQQLLQRLLSVVLSQYTEMYLSESRFSSTSDASLPRTTTISKLCGSKSARRGGYGHMSGRC